MGKIREALADRLRRELNIDTSADDLWVQNPCFSKWDCARWGGNGFTAEGISVNVHSWDTMADCVSATELGVVGNEIGLIEITAIVFAEADLE